MAGLARRVIPSVALLLALLAACTPPSSGPAADRPAGADAAAAGESAPAPPRRVRAAYVVLGSSALPAWLAEDQGLFQKYGLTVELSYIAGQVKIGEAIIAGELDVGIGPVELTVGPALEGADLVMVASWNGRAAFSALVQPGIQTVADLQGKRVAVTRRGSLSETWASRILGQFGLAPDRDYTLVPIGGQGEQLAALQAGAIDAAVLAPPTNLRARQLGYHELLSYYDFNFELAGMGVNTTRRYLREQPETLDRLVRALAEGVAIMHQDPDTSVTTLGRYMKVDDRELLDEALRFEQSRSTRDLLPTRPGVQAALDELARHNPKATTANPDDYVDLTLVRHLNDSGFIPGLYR
jgi:ABC-type nitrate/sulfonate/bicarbonate transport system substrate-binding protein